MVRDPKDRQELIDLGAPEPLLMRYVGGSSNELVVVFSGVGSDPSTYPGIEFFAAATQNHRNHAIFVSDNSRSWLNAPGIDDAIVKTILSFVQREGLLLTTLLGNSMGGTMALLLAERLGGRVVLSFCPQYSVHPKIVPMEKRWRRYRKKIHDYKYESVEPKVADDQTTIIVHGGTDGELMHAARFPLVRGVRHFIIPQHGHNLAKDLNKTGDLRPIVGAACEARLFRFRKLVEKSGGMFLKDFLKSNPDAASLSLQ